MMHRDEHLESSEATESAGKRLGRELQGGEKVLLRGPLGAGKTTFMRGVVRGFGAQGEVTSPTFTLIHAHRGDRGTLHHIDLYRIEEPSELLEIGFLDLWDSPDVVVVEWGDRLPSELREQADLDIELSMEGDGRRLRIEVHPQA